MPRSCDGIGALAVVLAKAQGGLTTSETPLTTPEARRQLPLCLAGERAGTVRQCLDQIEFAVMHATPVEEAAACLRLATVLVHASGEWNPYDWPSTPSACLPIRIANGRR